MKYVFKDLFRTIQKTKGRFLAIASICALGIGFFAGLQMTSGDMKLALSDYYNDTNFMDIRVACSLGLEDKNIQDLRNIDGVDGVMPAYTTDILTVFGNDETVIRLHSLNSAAYESEPGEKDKSISDDNNYLNRLTLVEGNWPINVDECVLPADIPNILLPKIGEYIEIKDCVNDLSSTLKTNKFKVCGYIRSPYYVSIMQMGPSKLGKGIINDFAYVPECSFADGLPYSEAFVRVEGSENYITGSTEYQNHIDNVMANIAAISPSESEIRSNSIKSIAQDKLDEAQNEFLKQKAQALEELDKNEQKLIDAKKKIDEGQSIYDSGKLELEQGYAQFNQQKAAVMDPLNQGVQQAESLYFGLQGVVDESSENLSQMQAAANKVNEASTVMEGLDEILNLLPNVLIIDNNFNSIFSQIPDIPKIIFDCINLNSAYAQALMNCCNAFKSDMVEHPENYESNLVEFNKNYTNLELTKNAELNLSAPILEQIKVNLDELYGFQSVAQAEFDRQEQPLIEAKKQLDDSRAELESGRVSYDRGYVEFLKAKSDALAQLADAQAKIDDSQKQIDGIEKPDFFIMDRTKNPGAITFNDDSDRMANIANVFPLLFFFVALLVALTSMTRMVDEERILIGTYKALGYSKSRISLKYIIYGFASSFTGSLIGVLLLGQALPYVIMNAYSIMYKQPIPFPMSYNAGIAAVSIALGVGTTLFATYLAASKTLTLQPSRLMIPTAPKAGKRILLEYIKPVWRLFNFNWKITFRNIFLYKRRLFMTVIGIAGCTALLLTGFGLHDSISDILAKQFDEICHDNYRVAYQEEYKNVTKDDVEKIAKTFDENSTLVPIYEETLVAQPKGHPDQSVILCVPQDVAAFQDLRVIQDMQTKERFTIGDNQVYINQKLADLLSVEKGDTFEVYNQDMIGNAGSEKYTFEIAGVFENYIRHYIYMTKDTYCKKFNDGFDPQYLTGHINLDSNKRQEFIDQVNQLSYVDSTYFNDENRETYDRMLGSVNLVVVILILAAGILAFVVLYNLININICERAREIATLKVLGSRLSEIYLYIHRETVLLSVLGCIFGVLMGFVLEYFVISSAEVDYVMFGRNIYWWSIVLSVGITLLFTIFVAMFMRKKLISISMVDSLKSIE